MSRLRLVTPPPPTLPFVSALIIVCSLIDNPLNFKLYFDGFKVRSTQRVLTDVLDSITSKNCICCVLKCQCNNFNIALIGRTIAEESHVFTDEDCSHTCQV